MITTCTVCTALYEAGSEEQAYEAERWCVQCRSKRGISPPVDIDADPPSPPEVFPPRR